MVGVGRNHLDINISLTKAILMGCRDIGPFIEQHLYDAVGTVWILTKKEEVETKRAQCAHSVTTREKEINVDDLIQSSHEQTETTQTVLQTSARNYRKAPTYPKPLTNSYIELKCQLM